MTDLLTEINPWMTATILAALMLATWALGTWRGRHLSVEDRAAPPSKFSDASLATLGLLLGFTFSLALSKHDQRRVLVVADSNAIGDFYTCASLVKDPAKTQLRAAVHAYVNHRLALAKLDLDPATMEKKLAEIRKMHDDMQTLVGQALDLGTPIAIALVNTFNGLTSSHAARLAGFRNRLPPSIVLLLVAAAMVTMVLAGTQQGAVSQRQYGATMGFVAMVCLVFWVILDLNQPQHGTITVSQEPLQRLLQGMEK